MTRERSSPVTVSVACPASLPDVIWWFVITPSISTSGVPLTVTTISTRTSGIDAPPARRKSVCSGERVLRVNVSWNAPGPSPPLRTSTAVKASRTSRGTGAGTPGPIIRVSRIPSTILDSRQALRQRDADDAAGPRGQVVRAQDRVRIAEPPELLGVAQVAGCERVRALSVDDNVLLQQREVAERGQEPTPQIGDRSAVEAGERCGVEAVVAAARREQRLLRAEL